MPTYRIYAFDGGRLIFSDPEIAECVDDKEAVEKAMQTANGLDVEIWDQTRLVARLPGNPPKGRTLK
jgi:hypothetical protein